MCARDRVQFQGCSRNLKVRPKRVGRANSSVDGASRGELNSASPARRAPRALTRKGQSEQTPAPLARINQNR